MMQGYDRSQLICQHSRLVTDRGVWVCPILLDAPDGPPRRHARRIAAAVRALPRRMLHVLSIRGDLLESFSGGIAP